MGKVDINLLNLNKMSNQPLMKPNFSRIEEIKAGRHCFNIYGRIVEMKKSEITKFNGETIKICDGVIADESGCANFRLVGDNVDKVQENMVISMRNGRSEVVDEHIRLEVDKFGKVQAEPSVNIEKVKREENIS